MSARFLDAFVAQLYPGADVQRLPSGGYRVTATVIVGEKDLAAHREQSLRKVRDSLRDSLRPRDVRRRRLHWARRV